jgi:hypothetical protein
MAPDGGEGNENPQTGFRIWQHILNSQKRNPQKAASLSGFSRCPVSLLLKTGLAPWLASTLPDHS